MEALIANELSWLLEQSQRASRSTYRDNVRFWHLQCYSITVYAGKVRPGVPVIYFNSCTHKDMPSQVKWGLSWWEAWKASPEAEELFNLILWGCNSCAWWICCKRGTASRASVRRIWQEKTRTAIETLQTTKKLLFLRLRAECVDGPKNISSSWTPLLWSDQNIWTNELGAEVLCLGYCAYTLG